MNKPTIIILVGPSCVGKSTIQKGLVAKGFHRLCSATTRPARPGEKNGKDYVFVSKEQFSHWQERNFFVETSEFDGDSYGLPFDEIRPNENYDRFVAVLDPYGAHKVKKNFLNEDVRVLIVFVLPFSKDHWEGMMRQRGIPEKDFDKKARTLLEWSSFIPGANLLVVNKNTASVVSDILEYVEGSPHP